MRSEGAKASATSQAMALPRRLGTYSLILLIVAFNAPIAAMAGFVQLSIAYGSGTAAPLSFLAGGAILLLFAVGFVEMSHNLERPGAFYSLILAGLGKSAGLAGAFVAMTAYFLLCAGSYPYMGIVIAEFAEHTVGTTVLPASLWGIVALVAITVIGLFRVDLSMRLLGSLVMVEVIVLAIWEVAVMYQGGSEGYSPASFSPSEIMVGAPGLGIMFAMLTMIGIEAGACFSAETKRPSVTVGRATYLAIAFLAVFYSLGTWCYVITQGPSGVVKAAAENPVGSFFDSVRTYIGGRFLPVVSLVLVTSQMAAINSIQGSAARYVYALSREGILPAWLGRVHPRLESPYAASLLVAGTTFLLLAVLLVFRIDPVMTYGLLTGMGIYFLLPMLIGTCAAVIVYFRRGSTGLSRAWKRQVAPAVAGTALIFLFAVTSFNLDKLVGSPVLAVVVMAMALVVPVAGVILAWWLRENRPAIYDRIGSVEI